MKQLLHLKFGYGGRPRRPLLPMDEQAVQQLLENEHIVSIMREEEHLRAKGP